MTQKPVLDYEPTSAISRRRLRIGNIALTAACVLAVPPLLLILGMVVLQHVSIHGLTVRELRQWLEFGWPCNLAGIVLATIAALSGKRKVGVPLLMLHVFSFLFAGGLPVF